MAGIGVLKGIPTWRKNGPFRWRHSYQADWIDPFAMKRSFDNVDHKVEEAEYFLSLIEAKNGLVPEINFLLSAYASAARSITFTLRAVLGDAPGFSEWYARHQTVLRVDSVAQFFVELRNLTQKTGATVVNRLTSRADLGAFLKGQFAGGKKHWFGSSGEDLPSAPDMDVAQGCRRNFVQLLEIIFSCYCDFGPLIDPQQHYTPEHYARIGKTIEDAEQELGYPRGWTGAGAFSDAKYLSYRFEMLRRYAAGACAINHLFEKYLGRVTSAPAPLPPLDLPEDQGCMRTRSGNRVWIPKASGKSASAEGDLKLYFESLRESRERITGETISVATIPSEGPDFSWLRELVFSAARQIPSACFHVPVAGTVHRAIRERLFCYEFYHQLRIVATASGFPYSIGGELDKGGHPIIRGDRIPDFVVHQPGCMDRNLCVMEVKPIGGSRTGFAKDLQTLTAFTRNYGYHRGVLFVFGDRRGGDQKFASRTTNIAELRAAGVLVWWLKQPGDYPVEL